MDDFSKKEAIVKGFLRYRNELEKIRDAVVAFLTESVSLPAPLEKIDENIYSLVFLDTTYYVVFNFKYFDRERGYFISAEFYSSSKKCNADIIEYEKRDTTYFLNESTIFRQNDGTIEPVDTEIVLSIPYCLYEALIEIIYEQVAI